MTNEFNLNFFVNGKYVGCELFNGTRTEATARANYLFGGYYYTRISLESKSGRIVEVFNAK